MSQNSKFVVKVTGLHDDVGWLSEAGPDGQRTVVDRPRAAVFPTRQDAHRAIATMPTLAEHASLIFSVEPAQ